MKKRIESLSHLPKPQKYFYKQNVFDNKKEKHLKHESNHKVNTQQKAKDDQPNKKNKKERETYKELIKQMNSPHLKELRTLVCSLINSADRLEPLAISQENLVQHYQKDRKKLIDYFNSLVVKQIDLSPSKFHNNHGKQRIGLLSPQEQKHLIQEVAEIKNNIQIAIAKKRSKSSLATFQKDFQRQFSLVKAKIKKLQETQCMNEESQLGAFIKQTANVKPDSKPKSKTNLESTQFLQDYESRDLQTYEKRIQHLKGQMCIQQQQKERILATLAYVQVLIFKSKQILSEVIEYGQNDVLKKFQKEYIQVTVLALDQGLQQCKLNKQQNNALLKLKHEAQSTIKSLCQCRKRVFLLLKQKEDLQKRLNEQKQAHCQQQGYYEQLQEKINKLNCEMGELVQEVEKKEELVEYLKVQSQNLKEDIHSLEQMLNQSRLHYQALTHELSDSGQRLKAAEEQINELMTEMQGRNRQLITKLQQIQKRDQQIHSLKLDINTKQQQTSLALKNSHQQKMLVEFARQQLESELKEHKHTIKFLSQQRTILQQKIQQVLTHEQDLKQRIVTLQQQFQLLERENQQLYKDIRSYQNSQSSSQQTVQQLVQSNRQLNEDISSLRSEIIEDHKKIKFYQQKLVELATLADTTEYEILIENQQHKIVQLEQKIKQLENPQNFKDNEDIIDEQIQSLTNEKNSLVQIHSQQKQCPPQNHNIQQQNQGNLLQKNQSPKSIVLNEIVPQKIEIDKDDNLLHIENNHLQGRNSVLSLYEIKVINENMDTVDTHKALHKKQKGNQILISDEADAPSEQKQSHNYIQEKQQTDPQIYRISHQQISPKCTSISSNQANQDFQFSNQQKQMRDIEESQQAKKRLQDLSNSIKRMPDIIMVDSTFKDQKIFTTNMKYQVEVMPQPQVQEKKGSQEKLSQINSKRSVIKPRNIYIMLGKNQGKGNRKGDSVHRSKSCFQVQV